MSSRQDPKRIEIIRKHLAAMADELNAHDINVVGIARRRLRSARIGVSCTP
jgi:hypothetical protein